MQACEVYHQTPVIFRGKVLDHNHDESLGFLQWTLYRVRVDEAFKGLPPATSEVFLNPGSFTSCYRSLPTGTDLLIYAYGGSQPVRFRQFYDWAKEAKSRDGSVKPLPVEWAELADVPVFNLGFCSSTRPIEPDDADLKYLREPKSPEGFLQGWVAQGGSWSSVPYRDRVPLAAANVTVIGGPVRRQVTSAQDGSYRLDGLPPGDYTVSVSKPAYPPQEVATKVTLGAGGCGVVRTTLAGTGEISGVVLTLDGRPAPKGTRVELGRLREDGSIAYYPHYWQETAEGGRFEFTAIPATPVVVGLNIGGAPSTKEPYDAVYAPGSSGPRQARVFRLRPGEKAGGVILRMPKALPFGNLTVEVLWPDGSPAEGAGAGADWNGSGGVHRTARGKSHRVQLPLAVGRTYEVRADWSFDDGGRFLSTRSSHSMAVPFASDGQVVTIHLADKPK